MVVKGSLRWSVFSLAIRKPRYSRFRLFLVTHFNTIFSTFREWFRRIMMRPHGWLAGYPHSPAIAQITLSSVKLRLSLSQFDCFCSLWHETLLRSLNTFYTCKQYWRFIINELLCFTLFVVFFYIFIVGRDSSVGIATRYGLDGPGIEARWGARFSVHVQTGPGAHPASYTMGTESFLGVKRPGRGVDHPPPSSADVKESVQLYPYSPSGPSWSVLGWALSLHLYAYFLYCTVSWYQTCILHSRYILM